MHIPFAGLFELLRPTLPCIDQIPGLQAAALESRCWRPGYQRYGAASPWAAATPAALLAGLFGEKRR